MLMANPIKHAALMLLLLLAALAACSPIQDATPVAMSASAQQPRPSSTPPSPATPTHMPPTDTPAPTPSPAPPSETVTVIGTSVAGRPLVVYSFGHGICERMIVAGMHGGYEWNTIALADQLIAHLRAHPETIPEDTTLHILRSLNPDGESRGQDIYARANENNVDLNRNWPSLWMEDWPPEGCWNALLPLSGGEYAGSEPETQALLAFLETHSIEALINYHSAALGIFPGGQPPDAASIDLAEALSRVSGYPYPPIDTGCLYSGQLIDWASDHGIAAVDIELSTHANTDFARNLTVLDIFLSWSGD
ncbi:MAG: hypothetical protein JXA97_09590 [Anaerolineales bacterium]|nr:hypothetical protein [Anaerolineales bacterium]